MDAHCQGNDTTCRPKEQYGGHHRVCCPMANAWLIRSTFQAFIVWKWMFLSRSWSKTLGYNVKRYQTNGMQAHKQASCEALLWLLWPKGTEFAAGIFLPGSCEELLWLLWPKVTEFSNIVFEIAMILCYFFPEIAQNCGSKRKLHHVILVVGNPWICLRLWKRKITKSYRYCTKLQWPKTGPYVWIS